VAPRGNVVGPARRDDGGHRGHLGLVRTQPDRQGCQVDVSLADSATWLLSGNSSELAGAHQAIPFSPRRRLYLCGDGRYITVAADEPPTWAALCAALELPEFAENVSPTEDEAREMTDRLSAISPPLPPPSGWSDWVHSARPWAS